MGNETYNMQEICKEESVQALLIGESVPRRQERQERDLVKILVSRLSFVGNEAVS